MAAEHRSFTSFQMVHTHTHTLAQNSHCEFWCGMHLTCKNASVEPDRDWLMTRSEKQCEGNLSMSLLKATNPSKPSRNLSWQIATTAQRQLQNDDMEVLGLSLFPLLKKIEQVRGLSVPNPYHCATDASSLDGHIWSTLRPPAWNEKCKQNRQDKIENRSFTSLLP